MNYVDDDMPFSWKTFDVEPTSSRFVTITNIYAFIRRGDLYKQNKKTKKNELMCPLSEATFVLNPIEHSDTEFEITVYDESKKDSPPILKTPLSKIWFQKIELDISAFLWIVGPKPYIPQRGSKGDQYIFVFDSPEDVRELSLELIKIRQKAHNYAYLK